MVHSANEPSIVGISGFELIGRGGFARVYRGYQAAFRRTVAVKVIQRSELAADDRSRFERECQAMGALSDHPNILTLYDAGYTDADEPYLVMPFVPDGTLQDEIARSGQLTWEEALSLGIRLSGALETSHRAGVLHRDVKPANVLLASYGAQLGDFGIARVTGGHETRTGVVTASLAHAPPEILDGKAPSPQSDLYSLASTLHEALSGTQPFSRGGAAVVSSLIHQIMLRPPPDLRPTGAPELLVAAIERAMSKDPGDRFDTALEFGTMLQDVQREQGLDVTEIVVLPIRGETDATTATMVDDPETMLSDEEPTRAVSTGPRRPGEPAPNGGPASVPPVPTVLARSERQPEQAGPTSGPDGTVIPTEMGGTPQLQSEAGSPGSFVGEPSSPTESTRGPLNRPAAFVLAVMGLVGGLGAAVGLAFTLGGDDGREPETSGVVVPLGTDPPDVTDPPATDQPSVTTGQPPVANLTLPPGDDIELELVHPGVETSVLEDLVGSFEVENPGVSVNLVDAGSYSGALRSAQAAGPAERPNVLFVADRAVQTVLDQLDPVLVSDFIARDDFDTDVLLDSAVDRYSTDSGLAAMPYNLSAPMLFVNREILAEAGVEIEQRDSLSIAELLEACDSVPESLAVCLEFDNNAYMYEQLVSNSGGLVFNAENGRSGEVTGVGLEDGPVGRTAFAEWSRIVLDGAALERTGTPLFFAGESAMYLTSTGALDWIVSNVRAGTGFEIGVAPFVHLDGVSPGGAVASGGALWVLNSGDDRINIASWLLIEHMASVESQVALHMESGYAPVRSDALESPELVDFWRENELYRVGYDLLAGLSPGAADPSSRGGRAGPFHQVDFVWATQLRAAQSGAVGIDEAFEIMVTESNELLVDYVTGER